MQNELITFGYSEKPLRITTDPSGNPWFVAKDVCAILDISWNGNVTLKSIPDDWKGVTYLHTPSEALTGRGGGEQELVTINQPGLFKLAFRSNKPEAERFTNWVAGEVLPSIMQTGQYTARGRKPSESTLMADIDHRSKNIASMAWAFYKEIEGEHSPEHKKQLAVNFYRGLMNKMEMYAMFLTTRLYDYQEPNPSDAAFRMFATTEF